MVATFTSRKMRGGGGGVVATYIRWPFFFSEWSGVGSGAIVTAWIYETMKKGINGKVK